MRIYQFSFLWIATSALLDFFTCCNAQTGDSLASARTLTAEEQQEALDFVLNKTLASAFETYGVESLEDRPPVIEMRNSSSTSAPHYDFQFRLNRMLQQLFQDAHIRVEVEETRDMYRNLDMCLSLISSGELGEESWDLISTCDTEYARIGDLIVSMGGFSTAELFDMLKEVTPHENDYFVAGLTGAWLVREEYLSYFGMLDSELNVTVVIERDGTVLDAAKVPLTGVTSEAAAAAETTNSQADWVSYEIMNQSSTAVFTLDKCRYDETYVATMTEFWTTVLNNPNIENVVLDLRANRGGDFTVAPAFLGYITSDAYALFDVHQRNSDDFCEQTPVFCDPNTLFALESLGAVNATGEYSIVPETAVYAFFSTAVTNPESLFGGNFYVLTSGVTFSSAHLFAGVVQRNGLGTLVGTPTGNSPTFWGNMIEFMVPHTDLTFFLTTSETVFPGEGDAIIPDVLISTTRDDILEQRDPQLDFITDGAETPPTLDPAGPTNEDESDDSSSVAISLAGLSTTAFVCSMLL